MSPYTEEQNFLAWIRTQKSCITGRYSEYVNGDGMCIAAHVRRANNSGVGMKPSLNAIPLTNDEHMHQHHYGEADCLTVFKSPYQNWQPNEAKAWFDREAEFYRHQYFKIMGTK